MDLNEYQNLAAGTAFYPGRNGNLPSSINHSEILKCNPIPFPGFIYTCLGLVGEIDELCSAIETGKSKDIIIKEFGDCYWYLSQFTMEIGVQFNEIGKKIDDIVVFADSIRYDGRLCELNKKVIRDNCGIYHPKTKERAIHLCKVIFKALESGCFIIGIDVDDVLKTNIEKLQSRKDRNALGGSGDER